MVKKKGASESTAKASGLQRANAGGRYLKQLQEMHFVVRRVPVTMRRFQRTTMGRYHLNDNYLQFYFRFVWPNLHLLELGLREELWETARAEMDSFVGHYAFPHLCQEWIWTQARAGELPFVPEHVGVHFRLGGLQYVISLRRRRPKCWKPYPTKEMAGQYTMPFSHEPGSRNLHEPMLLLATHCWWI